VETNLKRLTLIAVVILVLAVVAIGTLKLLNNRSAYTLTSYKQQATTQTITMHYRGYNIRAECQSNCDEFGAMVGQNLFCFTEPAPSDTAHPYGTKRPIFSPMGGSFVCRTDGGTGIVFLVRKYKCLKEATEFDRERQLRNEFPGDALYMSEADLDKLYCKADEVLSDQGGDFVTENGKVLPPVGGQVHTELLKIVEVK
jgi:hypothetical protein